MMYPRLALLRQFLTEDGAIFISIENNEHFNLKLVCDEIFGAQCFVTSLVWQRTYSPRNDSKGIPAETDSILVYGKHPGWKPNKLERTPEMNGRYASPDNDPRPWSSGDASAAGASNHTGMVYAVQHPLTGELIYPINGRHWTYGQEQMLAIMNEWAAYELRPIDDFEKRFDICGTRQDKVPTTIPAILLTRPFDEVKEETKKRYDKGIWPFLYFTGKGKGGIRCKRYLDVMGDRLVTNLWFYSEVGHTDEASKELKTLFDGKTAFDTPKPTRLLERIFQIASNPNDLVLDSFAGSGTTGHAILKMNAQASDKPPRRLILVEMESEIARTVTAERVRRVAQGYTNAKGEEVAGLCGGFRYCELGEPLFDETGMIRETVKFSELARHVYFSETGEPLPRARVVNTPLLGVCRGVGIYLLYNGILGDESVNGGNVLTRQTLAKLPPFDGPKVIYCAGCLLSRDRLQAARITIRQTPYEIKVS
jgi:adenine-specific DNA-methyltransferase